MSRSYQLRGKSYNPKEFVIRKSGRDLEDYKNSHWNHGTRKQFRYERMRRVEDISYLEEIDDYENRCEGQGIYPNKYTQTSIPKTSKTYYRNRYFI